MKPDAGPIRWAYDAPELGRAVKRVRRENNLTQKDLAERLGVARMTVSRLERGEAVSIETAIRALSECGYALAVAPKFSRLVIESPPGAAVSFVATSRLDVG
jgi:HTH-type transcriptional regulator/antitoxin HipB